MTDPHTRTSPTSVQTRPRKIVRRTRGNRHGPITRLMSPSDLGQVLKPFVFLDLFDTENATFQGMGLHPHSGIAMVTYLFEGSVRYEDSTGATGVLPAGGVEWFKAAHGAWHGGGFGDAARTRSISNCGWRCRPITSSDQWKTSTWPLTPSRATVRRVCWSAPTAERPAQSMPRPR